MESFGVLKEKKKKNQISFFVLPLFVREGGNGPGGGNVTGAGRAVGGRKRTWNNPSTANQVTKGGRYTFSNGGAWAVQLEATEQIKHRITSKDIKGIEIVLIA